MSDTKTVERLRKSLEREARASAKSRKQAHKAIIQRLKSTDEEEVLCAINNFQVDDFFIDGGGITAALKLLQSKNTRIARASLRGIVERLHRHRSLDTTKGSYDFLYDTEGPDLIWNFSRDVDALSILEALETGTKWHGSGLLVELFESADATCMLLSLQCFRLLLCSVVRLPVSHPSRWRFLSMMVSAADPIRKLLRILAAGIVSEQLGLWRAFAADNYIVTCCVADSSLPIPASPRKPKVPRSAPASVWTGAPVSPEASLEAARCLRVILADVYNPLRCPEAVGSADCNFNNEAWERWQQELWDTPPPSDCDSHTSDDFEHVSGNVEAAILAAEQLPLSFSEKYSNLSYFQFDDRFKASDSCEISALTHSFAGDPSNFVTDHLSGNSSTKKISHALSAPREWHPLRRCVHEILIEDVSVAVTTTWQDEAKHTLDSHSGAAGASLCQLAQGGEPHSEISSKGFNGSIWSLSGYQLVLSLCQYLILPVMHSRALKTDLSPDLGIPLRKRSLDAVDRFSNVAFSEHHSAIEQIDSIANIEASRATFLQRSLRACGAQLLAELSWHQLSVNHLLELGAEGAIKACLIEAGSQCLLAQLYHRYTAVTCPQPVLRTCESVQSATLNAGKTDPKNSTREAELGDQIRMEIGQMQEPLPSRLLQDSLEGFVSLRSAEPCVEGTKEDNLASRIQLQAVSLARHALQTMYRFKLLSMQHDNSTDLKMTAWQHEIPGTLRSAIEENRSAILHLTRSEGHTSSKNEKKLKAKSSSKTKMDGGLGSLAEELEIEWQVAVQRERNHAVEWADILRCMRNPSILGTSSTVYSLLCMPYDKAYSGIFEHAAGVCRSFLSFPNQSMTIVHTLSQIACEAYDIPRRLLSLLRNPSVEQNLRCQVRSLLQLLAIAREPSESGNSETMSSTMWSVSKLVETFQTQVKLSPSQLDTCDDILRGIMGERTKKSNCFGLDDQLPESKLKLDPWHLKVCSAARHRHGTLPNCDLWVEDVISLLTCDEPACFLQFLCADGLLPVAATDASANFEADFDGSHTFSNGSVGVQLLRALSLMDKSRRDVPTLTDCIADEAFLYRLIPGTDSLLFDVTLDKISTNNAANEKRSNPNSMDQQRLKRIWTDLHLYLQRRNDTEGVDLPDFSNIYATTLCRLNKANQWMKQFETDFSSETTSSIRTSVAVDGFEFEQDQQFIEWLYRADGPCSQITSPLIALQVAQASPTQADKRQALSGMLGVSTSVATNATTTQKKSNSATKSKNISSTRRNSRNGVEETELVSLEDALAFASRINEGSQADISDERIQWSVDAVHNGLSILDHLTSSGSTSNFNGAQFGWHGVSPLLLRVCASCLPFFSNQWHDNLESNEEQDDQLKFVEFIKWTCQNGDEIPHHCHQIVLRCALHSVRVLSRLVRLSPLESSLMGSLGLGATDSIFEMALPFGIVDAKMGMSDVSQNAENNVIKAKFAAHDSVEVFISQYGASFPSTLAFHTTKSKMPQQYVLSKQCINLREAAMWCVASILDAEKSWRCTIPRVLESAKKHPQLAKALLACVDGNWSTDNVDINICENIYQQSKTAPKSWSAGWRAAIACVRHIPALVFAYSSDISQRCGHVWSVLCLRVIARTIAVPGAKEALLNYMSAQLEPVWLKSVCKSVKCFEESCHNFLHCEEREGVTDYATSFNASNDSLSEAHQNAFKIVVEAVNSLGIDIQPILNLSTDSLDAMERFAVEKLQNMRDLVYERCSDLFRAIFPCRLTNLFSICLDQNQQSEVSIDILKLAYQKRTFSCVFLPLEWKVAVEECRSCNDLSKSQKRKPSTPSSSQRKHVTKKAQSKDGKAEATLDADFANLMSELHVDPEVWEFDDSIMTKYWTKVEVNWLVGGSGTVMPWNDLRAECLQSKWLHEWLETSDLSHAEFINTMNQWRFHNSPLERLCRRESPEKGKGTKSKTNGIKSSAKKQTNEAHKGDAIQIPENDAYINKCDHIIDELAKVRSDIAVALRGSAGVLARLMSSHAQLSEVMEKRMTSISLTVEKEHATSDLGTPDNHDLLPTLRSIMDEFAAHESVAPSPPYMFWAVMLEANKFASGLSNLGMLQPPQLNTTSIHPAAIIFDSLQTITDQPKKTTSKSVKAVKSSSKSNTLSKGKTLSSNEEEDVTSFSYLTGLPAWRTWSPFAVPVVDGLLPSEEWLKFCAQSIFAGHVAQEDREAPIWSVDLELLAPTRDSGARARTVSSDLGDLHQVLSSAPILPGSFEYLHHLPELAHIILLESCRRAVIDDVISHVLLKPLTIGLEPSVPGPMTIGVPNKSRSHHETCIASTEFALSISFDYAMPLVYQRSTSRQFASCALRRGFVVQQISMLQLPPMNQPNYEVNSHYAATYKAAATAAVQAMVWHPLIVGVSRQCLESIPSFGDWQSALRSNSDGFELLHKAHQSPCLQHPQKLVVWNVLLNQCHECTRFRTCINFCEDAVDYRVPEYTVLHCAMHSANTDLLGICLGPELVHDLMSELSATLHNPNLYKRFSEGNCPPFNGLRLSEHSEEGWCTENVVKISQLHTCVNVLDDVGRSPAAIAFSVGFYPGAHALLRCGADIDAVCGNGDPLLKYALCLPDRDVSEHHQNVLESSTHLRASGLPAESVYTVASVAADAGDTAEHPKLYSIPLVPASPSLAFMCVRQLYDAGADAGNTDRSGNTLLFWLSANCHISSQFASSQIILTSPIGADKSRKDTLQCLLRYDEVQRHINKVNMHGETALHGSLAAGNPALAQVLLERDAYPNYVDSHGNLPVHYACLGRGSGTAADDCDGDEAGVNIRLLLMLLNLGVDHPIRRSSNFSSTPTEDKAVVVSPVKRRMNALEATLSDTFYSIIRPSTLFEQPASALAILQFKNEFGFSPFDVSATGNIVDNGLASLGFLDSSSSANTNAINGDEWYAPFQQSRKEPEDAMTYQQASYKKVKLFDSAFQTAIHFCCRAQPQQKTFSALEKRFNHLSPDTFTNATDQYIASLRLPMFAQTAMGVWNEYVIALYALEMTEELNARMDILKWLCNTFHDCAAKYENVAIPSALVVHRCIATWFRITNVTRWMPNISIGLDDNPACDVSQNLNDDVHQYPYYDEHVSLCSTSARSFKFGEGNKNKSSIQVRARPVISSEVLDLASESSFRLHNDALALAHATMRCLKNMARTADFNGWNGLLHSWFQVRNQQLQTLVQSFGDIILNNIYRFQLSCKFASYESALVSPLSVALLADATQTPGLSRNDVYSPTWALLSVGTKAFACELQMDAKVDESMWATPIDFLRSPARVLVSRPNALSLAAATGVSKHLFAFLTMTGIKEEDALAIKTYNTRIKLLEDFSRGLGSPKELTSTTAAFKEISSTPGTQLPKQSAFIQAQLREIENQLAWSTQASNLATSMVVDDIFPWPEPHWTPLESELVVAQTEEDTRMPTAIRGCGDIASFFHHEELRQFVNSIPPLHYREI